MSIILFNNLDIESIIGEGWARPICWSGCICTIENYSKRSGEEYENDGYRRPNDTKDGRVLIMRQGIRIPNESGDDEAVDL